jgi:succinoglycan biosynthesis transport protein ExoP
MTNWNRPEQIEYPSADDYLGIVRRIVVRRWWLICLLIIVAAAAGLGGSMLAEPVYRASTTIRIQKNVLPPPGRYGSSAFGTGGPLETEALWLTNRSLLSDVMDKTGIAATARTQEERIAVMEKLRANIGVTALSDSLQVTVDWNDAESAATIANTLADSFIERYGAVNREEARELRALLEQQVGLVRLRVDEGQRMLSEFVKEHGDIDVNREEPASDQRLAALQTELAQSNVALSSKSRRLELLQKQMGKNGETLSKAEFDITAEQIGNNPAIQSLQKQIVQLEQRVAALSSLYRDEYPELKTANAQLRQAQTALGQEFAKLVPGLSIPLDDAAQIERLVEYIRLRSETEDLKNRQNELTTVIAKLEKTARQMPDKEAQYFSLLRNQRINEDLYNTLLGDLTKAKIAEQTDTWDVRVLEMAYAPHSRLRPKPVKNAAFGGVVGLLLGVLLCMLMEYLDDSFKTAEEVERDLQLPVLAVLPKFDLPAVEYERSKYR